MLVCVFVCMSLCLFECCPKPNNLSSATWGSRPFKIQHLSTRYGENVDRMLPIAHTCFFSIELPAYTTLDAITDRVSFAMVWCTILVFNCFFFFC